MVIITNNNGETNESTSRRKVMLKFTFNTRRCSMPNINYDLYYDLYCDLILKLFDSVLVVRN